MNEYILFFRLDILDESSQPSEKEMERYMEQWMAWLQEISSEGRLADGGNHLQKTGKVIRPGKIIDNKPYSASGESIAGYIIIYAHDLEDAARIAEGCPILNGSDKNSVEVRGTASP